VAEEARFRGEHHNPSIQLLGYGEGELDEMRTALEPPPRLKELLRQLIAG
jgi:hypothetical protein